MKTTLIFLLTIALVLGAFPALAQDSADLLGRINTLRGSLGLHPYALNGALSTAAQDQAQWMVSTGQVTHDRPDGSTVRARASAAGYTSSWVSENIYMGSIATINDAWNFWMNSSVHYRGITNANYDEVGIGVASGTHGRAFVLVFGSSSGGAWNASGGTSSGGAASSSANSAPQQPSFVVGVDNVGNIMHEIQPDDTLGEIALIYGYTWDDLAYIREINELDENSLLAIGAVLLVPPKAGTYTPVPSPTPAVTAPPPTSTFLPPPTDTPTPDVVAQAATPAPLLPPTDTSAPDFAAQADQPAIPMPPPTDTPAPETDGLMGGLIEPATYEVVVIEKDNTPRLLLVAVGLQVLLVVIAGVEFFRRGRK